MLNEILSQDGLPILMLVVGIGVGMAVLAGAQQLLRIGQSSPGQLWPDGEPDRNGGQS